MTFFLDGRCVLALRPLSGPTDAAQAVAKARTSSVAELLKKKILRLEKDAASILQRKTVQNLFF